MKEGNTKRAVLFTILALSAVVTMLVLWVVFYEREATEVIGKTVVYLKFDADGGAVRVEGDTVYFYPFLQEASLRASVGVRSPGEVLGSLITVTVNGRTTTSNGTVSFAIDGDAVIEVDALVVVGGATWECVGEGRRAFKVTVQSTALARAEESVEIQVPLSFSPLKGASAVKLTVFSAGVVAIAFGLLTTFIAMDLQAQQRKGQGEPWRKLVAELGGER